MNVRRAMFSALVVMIVLLGATATATAQTSCVPFIKCPSDNSKIVMRYP